MRPYTCPVCGAHAGDGERLSAPGSWLWVLEHAEMPYGRGIRFCSRACLVAWYSKEAAP